MRIRTLAVFVVLAAACDDAPNYSDQPGIDVCERIVETCGDLCTVEIDEDPYKCTSQSYGRYIDCADSITREENLQEVAAEFPTKAADAATGAVIGYGTCYATLSDVPIFCYGCRD